MNCSHPVTDELAVTPYVEEINVVARRGHKDRSTENLLLACVELYKEHPALVEEFIAVFLQRAGQKQLEITPRAFRLSLLTAIKLYLRTRDIKAYEFFSVQTWKHVVMRCLSSKDEEFIRYCLRDVSTVKIYRYVALQILGGMLKHAHGIRNGLRILDGGCSINAGLKCLNDLSIFQPVQVAPHIAKVLGGALTAFPLQLARGIDKYPPSLERTLASLFPSEVKLWEDLYTKLYYFNKKQIQYEQRDILYLDQDEGYYQNFEIVFLSSLLRRFPPHQIADVLVQVNYATSPHSFLVINEQMSKDTIEGGGTYATFILPKALLSQLDAQSRNAIDLYELLTLAFEVLIYPDENCQKVCPGKDFDTFLQLYTTTDAVQKRENSPLTEG